MSSEEEEYRYLTFGELGKGGMGTVWEMHDTALNRRIAFKQMHPAFVGMKSMEARFVNEAKILALLEHPGVVPIHELDVSTEDGAYYYTMDKVRGESLQSILDGLKNRNKATLRRWTLVRLLGAFSQLCETVAFAHEKGILHRDLKPDNVMLGRHGEVFLVDWGIAKRIGTEEPADDEDSIRIQETRLADGGTRLFTLEENVFGTPEYMSPEAAQGLDSFSDGGSDIFALGAILYQILTLNPPHQGNNPDEMLEAAKLGKIVPVGKIGGLRTHLPGGRAPDALASIAMMALSENREDRYATAQDMRRDIEAFLQGRLTRAQEAGALKMMHFFVKRNPGTSFVGFFATISVIGILFFGLNENYQNRIEAEKARDLALEKKEVFLAAKSATIADRTEAAPRFAQLAWDRLKLCDFGRAEDLALAALEFSDGAEASARSHLVLGLVKVLQGRPDLAEPHWELAEEGGLVNNLKKAKAKKLAVSWPGLLDEAGLYALAIKQLEAQPDQQFEKIQEILKRNWDSGLWEISNGNSERSVFFRLVLKNGITPQQIEFIRGWPIHHLILRGIPLADLGRMSDLPELRILEIHEGHLVKDLSPLAELTKLTSLSFASLQSSPDYGFDLSPLASLTRLEHLDFKANALSLVPLRDLKLSKLRVGSLIRNSSLLSLHGMPLKSLEVENPGNLDSLLGMPLEQFRPGYASSGYSKREMDILSELPLKEIRFDGAFGEEIIQLARSKTLVKLETNHLHDLKIWKPTSLKSIHLKGNDHDFSGIAKTLINHLEISPDEGVKDRMRPVLHSLLRATQVSEITINHPGINEEGEYHVHLENPVLTESLILEDWTEAENEFERLQKRYLRHHALEKLASEWLPVLENHLKKARAGQASHTWQPSCRFDGHLYQWFKTPMPWAEAKKAAAKLGGHLVSVESIGEWQFLERGLGIPLNPKSAWSGGGNRIWIGSAIPGTADTVSPFARQSRRGEAPSVYLSSGKLVLAPTSPESVWSFVIEWDRPERDQPSGESPPTKLPAQ